MNGRSRVPPGFRFHPTEEELLSHYLRKKVASKNIDLDVIREVDVNKLEPWDIQEECRIGSTPQDDWYFFSHKDKKYPTGTRTNRATTAGFWKATGRDKVIRTSAARIGMRKTLVFYKGRAPHGQKSDWIMHEYRLDDPQDARTQHNVICGSSGELISKEVGWVVCRVFKKKNLQKAFDGNSSLSMICNSNRTIIDHSLQYMGRSHEQEDNLCSNTITNPTTLDEEFHENFITLPVLESLSIPLDEEYLYGGNWPSYDRFVESQLNCSSSTTDMDLWTMTTTLL